MTALINSYFGTGSIFCFDRMSQIGVWNLNSIRLKLKFRNWQNETKLVKSNQGDVILVFLSFSLVIHLFCFLCMSKIERKSISNPGTVAAIRLITCEVLKNRAQGCPSWYSPHIYCFWDSLLFPTWRKIQHSDCECFRRSCRTSPIPVAVRPLLTASIRHHCLITDECRLFFFLIIAPVVLVFKLFFMVELLWFSATILLPSLAYFLPTRITIE